MSIASRITAIEEHIRDVYDTIDYSYDTTDVDKNIINIPQNIFNGYINILNDNGQSLWNNLEKVSASGETPVLENVETAPMKIVLNGNTSQETTTGKNLFTTDYLTSNSFTTYTKLSDNSFSFTATGTWKKASYKVPCKPNTNYYFNFSSTSSMYIQIRGVQTGTQIVAVYQAYLTTFNSGENTELQINIDIGQNSIASGTISDIQLEEGTTATSFEKYTGGQPSPSPDYPQEVKVVKGENVVSVSGKNLFDKDNQAKIQVNAGGTLRYGLIVDASNKKVSISGKNWSGYIAYKPLTNGVYGQWININRDTTINVTDKLIIYSNGDTIKLDTYVDDLQIEISDTPTNYVPYSKTDYPINLGDIELCKINTYKDYFHKDSGKWYVHKEIGKVVLDGSESGWQKRGSSTNSYIIIQRSFRVGGNICMSDKFIYSGSYDGQFEHILVNSSWNENLITIDTSRLTENSLNGAKQWLSTNQPNMYYPLATPTEEEITNTTLIEQLEAISKAKSVKDKTYITQTNDELPFILDVEAIKEYSVE